MEGRLGELARCPRELLLLVAQAQGVDEVLDRGHALGRERPDLGEELLLVATAPRLTHRDPPDAGLQHSGVPRSPVPALGSTRV